MNDDIMALHKRVVKYLNEIKVVPSDQILPGAHDDSIAREALKELKLKSPVARLKAVPIEKGYPLVQDAKRIQEYVELGWRTTCASSPTVSPRATPSS